jgi:hypothetical protein
MAMANMTLESSLATARFKKIEEVMQDGIPRCIKEIADLCHISRWGCQPYIMDLHLEQKKIHIKKWRTRQIALYVWGDGKDAKQPKKKTVVQIAADYRKRIKKDPDRYEQYLKMHKADKIKRTMRTKPRADVAAAWISTNRETLSEA